MAIIQVGHPGFRNECLKVPKDELASKEINMLVALLKRELKTIGGVGLAAPQLGMQKQVFVVSIAPTKFRPDLPTIPVYAVFNPVITTSDLAVAQEYEGCFSVAEANLFALVKRPRKITVLYHNENGEQVKRTLSGIEAVIFQHEYDHLYGKVFLDRNVDISSIMSANEYRAMRKRSLHC